MRPQGKRWGYTRSYTFFITLHTLYCCTEIDWSAVRATQPSNCKISFKFHHLASMCSGKAPFHWCQDFPACCSSPSAPPLWWERAASSMVPLQANCLNTSCFFFFFYYCREYSRPAARPLSCASNDRISPTYARSRVAGFQKKMLQTNSLSGQTLAENIVFLLGKKKKPTHVLQTDKRDESEVQINGFVVVLFSFWSFL